jgi:release factor glutamine methyltransferase
LTTIGELLRQAASRLKEVGTSSPTLDAELLLADCLGCRREDLLLDRGRVPRDDEQTRFARHLERRLAREPVARILGRKEFWSLDFTLNEATLVPRPESETVVEAALALVGPSGTDNHGISILDLGCGSGCLVLALLYELPSARGLGTDMSDRALEAARGNAQNLGLADRVRFEAVNWHEATGWSPGEAPFELIVSNPPYIDKDDILTLEPEVRDHDPRAALDGGAGGLAHYPAIIEVAMNQMADGGWFVVEIGSGQSPALMDLLRVYGLCDVSVVEDLAGRPRVVYGKKP